MEFKLFDSRFTCPAEIMRLRTHSNLFFGHRSSVNISRQLCQGIFLKASYSPSRANASVDSVDQEKYVVGKNSSRFIGTNGACSFFEGSMVLEASEDEYEGVVVNPERLPSNPNAFSSSLRSSLSYWQLKGKKGVWLKLPLEQSELVPIAVKEGFQYHHAEKEYVMLTYWIPAGSSMLPANASHQVGVGGFVINEKNEILVVQEKHHAPTFEGVWKLPTGFILEIDTEFVEVIAFRHAHNVAFEKSDLFFICMLKPLSTQIKIDDLEIQDAKWMSLAEFVEQPHIKGDSMFMKIIDICIARLKKRYCGLSAHHVISKFDGRSSSLYCSVVDGQDFNCLGG
ncbi:hypothetical protein GIB67_008647 [Kingdonia uniflora]|uniref:Pre-nudix hydrolase domain-containing protein n=1 Tax=Kingdonia uniflora TaxID=39325 RepID=A0A7J7M4Y6_9MAGN|nr:hypothetical protein GIB67_008647 [Kingdonia uniflora]